MVLNHPAFRRDPTLTFVRFKTLYPKVDYFKEILPFASKDRVISQRGRPGASSCVQEMQALFGCMKKWEFDDLQCQKFQDVYMRCIQKHEAVVRQYKEAAKKGILGDGDGQSITSTQFNKLMKLWPQPEMGTQPYRQEKRLPTQSYADDIFHRKSYKKKPS